MSLNIAIIGAGPAGCTLACILLQSSHNISITIFEGEASFDARAQGGTLDLHTKTGLLALQKAGLYNKFLEYARFDGEAMVLADKHMKRYINFSGADAKSSRGRPEIDRKDLRQLLLDSLPEGLVKWGHRLRKITSPSSSSSPKDLIPEFEHASVSGFDLIVGGDGAYSKVRPLLSDDMPFFSGVGCVRLGINNVATAAPDIYRLVNRGSLFAFGDCKGLMMQQLGDGSLTVSAMLTQSSPLWLKTSPWCDNDLETIKDRLLSSEFADWDPQLRAIIEKSDQTPWIANMNMLPVGNSWEHRPGLTLLGDAAHLATPFAGEGVNLAMEDAIHLSSAILTAATSPTPSTALSPAIASFEKDMFVRAKKMQEKTFKMMQLNFYNANAPDATIEEWICYAAGTSLPAYAYPFLQVAVYAYYCYFRLWHRFWATDAKA